MNNDNKPDPDELTPEQEQQILNSMDATVDDADAVYDKVQPARAGSDNNSRGK